MRFRFLGGSDAPDWILAEVSILAKMVHTSHSAEHLPPSTPPTPPPSPPPPLGHLLSLQSSVRMKLICRQVLQQLTGKGVAYDKVAKLTSSTRVQLEVGDVKALIATLHFIFASAAKHDVNGQTLLMELEQLGLPKGTRRYRSPSSPPPPPLCPATPPSRLPHSLPARSSAADICTAIVREYGNTKDELRAYLLTRTLSRQPLPHHSIRCAPSLPLCPPLTAARHPRVTQLSATSDRRRLEGGLPHRQQRPAGRPPPSTTFPSCSLVVAPPFAPPAPLTVVSPSTTVRLCAHAERGRCLCAPPLAPQSADERDGVVRSPARDDHRPVPPAVRRLVTCPLWAPTLRSRHGAAARR